MKLFIEENFEAIVKVWIVISTSSGIFFKDIYVLGMHIILILFLMIYYKKIKEVSVYWLLMELTAILKVLESIIKLW